MLLLLALSACGGGGGGGSSGESAGGTTPAAAAGTSASTSTSTSATQVTPPADAAPATTPPSTAPVSGPNGAPTSDANAALSTFARAALAGVNRIRASARVCDPGNAAVLSPATTPVGWSDQLAASARVHASDMQVTNTFSHTGSDGSTVGDRVIAQGYAWSTVGETQAAGFVGIDEVLAEWTNSPVHCAILMNPDFSQVGLAQVDGTSANTYSNYWTLDLAHPL